MEKEKIGIFLKTLRENSSLSQRMLADKLNITTQAISKWETGNGIPDIEIIEDLSLIYDISINEILNGNRIDKYSTSKTYVKGYRFLQKISYITVILLLINQTIALMINTSNENIVFPIMISIIVFVGIGSFIVNFVIEYYLSKIVNKFVSAKFIILNVAYLFFTAFIILVWILVYTGREI